MGMIKTTEEIALIKKACFILKEVKKEIKKFIKAGITPLYLDKIAYKKMKQLGGKPNFLHYQGFPNSICVSVNEQLIHGIPNDRPFQEGDVVSIDCGVKWKGYHSDSAFTIGIGEISSENQKLIKVAEEAFFAGLSQIKPGAFIGDVEWAIGELIAKKGYYTPDTFAGHGIGQNLHEEPSIFNFGIKKTGPLIKNGMIFCVEPMILQGSSETFFLDDNWTVVASSKRNASHYEHTVLIENNYPKILT